MKSNKEDIDKKVADALSSLDDVERAEVSPFFYTRLKARMQKEEKGFWSLFINPQFSMAVAGVFLLFCLNFYMMINYKSTNGIKEDEVSAFISDYQIDADYIYELNE